MIRRRALVALCLSPSSAFALTVPAPAPEFRVVAEGRATLDGPEPRESLGCRLSASDYDPYWEGIWYRWDIDGDGSYEQDWSPSPDYDFSAAGRLGPSTTVARIEAQCWFFNIFTFAIEADFGSVDVPLVIENAPPWIDRVDVDGADPSDLPRGVPLTFRANSGDPEAGDTLTHAWVWSDGLVQSGNPVERTFTGAGSVFVDVTVRDGVASDSVRASFGVEDEAPVITAFTVPAAASEGETVLFEASAQDAYDALTYTWRVNPGGATLGGEQAQWTAGDDAVYRVRLEVSDGRSTVVEEQDLTVSNLPPIVDALAFGEAWEGQDTLLTVAATDPGGDTMRSAWTALGVTLPFGPVGQLGATVQFPDDGVHPVSVTVEDDDGAAASRSGLLTVLNVPPELIAVSVPSVVDEGMAFEVGALASDVPADPLSYTWRLNGSVVAQTPSFIYALPSGVHALSLEVDDGDGGVITRAWNITSNDLPPELTLTVPASASEGEAVILSASAVDPAGDVVEITWNFGDGSPEEAATRLEHTWADDGVYEVVVTARDRDGGIRVAVASIEVINVDPTILDVTVPSVFEGAAATFEATAEDPGADVVVFNWSLDGAPSGVGPTWTRTFPDEGPHELRVIASDNDGGVAEAVRRFEVQNVAPVVEIVGDVDDAGSTTLAWTARAEDPGADTLTWQWDFGDGATAVSDNPGMSHAFVRNGRFTVRVTVDDGDGGVGTDEIDVVISSFGPQITEFSVPESVDEGQAATMRCVAAARGGPGVLNVAWAFGDGGTATGEQVSHAWADDGLWDVACTVTDPFGQTDFRADRVEVLNVEPRITGAPPTTVVAGDAAVFAPGVVDPGTADVHDWRLDGPPGATIDPDTGLVTWRTGPGDVGFARMEVTVRDDDGGEGSIAFDVEVITRDLDRDGMDDFWELANGLSPTDPNDAGLDPDTDGRTNLDEYEVDSNPNVSNRPGAPVLLDPTGGEEVATATPALRVGAPSVGDAPLSYDVRLYADAGLTALVDEQIGVPGTDDGVVVFAPALNEGAASWWIARASDAWASGPWSAPESFVVDALQEPPGVPVLIEPRDGTTVGVSDPVLRWSEVTDPDGDEVIYELYWTDGALSYFEAVTDTRWRISPGLADGTAVAWAVLATDASGSGMVASETWTFVVDTSNQPPSSPVVLYPTPDGTLEALPAAVEVSNGVDPEGRATTQRFEIDTVASFDGPDLQWAELASEADGTTRWSPAPLREDTLYHLRVLADDGASSSPWTQTTFFVNAQNDPPTAPFPVLPLDGEIWFEGVALVVANATDPEGFELRYEFVVYDDSGTIKAQSTSVPSGVDRTEWAPSGLPPGVFTWTARATDPLGAQGPWSESWSFLVAGPGPGPNSRTVPPPVDVDPADVLTGCGCASADPARWGGLAALGWLVLLRRRR